MRYEPTDDILDTAKNVLSYLRNNLSLFIDVLRPVLPLLVTCAFFDVIMTEILYEPEDENSFVLGGIFSAYFMTVFIINWHRVIIYGPGNYTPMQAFSPKKHEIVFLGMAIAVGLLIGFGSGLAVGVLFGLFGVPGLILGAFVVIGVLLVATKLSFYFPAKAIDKSITLGQSFNMTDGYVVKLLVTNLLANLVMILFMLGLLLLMAVFSFFLGLMLQGFISAQVLGTVIGMVFIIPFIVVNAAMTALGVSVISNYYLIAKNTWTEPMRKPMP